MAKKEAVKEEPVAEDEAQYIRDYFAPPPTAPENSIHENANTGVRHRFNNGTWSAI